jgi:hypothetical protein
VNHTPSQTPVWEGPPPIVELLTKLGFGKQEKLSEQFRIFRKKISKPLPGALNHTPSQTPVWEGPPPV